MSHRRRPRALLALALAALVVLPASLALAAPGRRGPSKVPAVGTTLVSADQKARLTVVVDRTARPKRAKAVILEWSLPATCPAGPSSVQLRARGAIRGNAFASTIDAPTFKQRFTGRFASRHKALGSIRVRFPDGRGGLCDTGTRRFVVTG
jgi:hypothetical protein